MEESSSIGANQVFSSITRGQEMKMDSSIRVIALVCTSMAVIAAGPCYGQNFTSNVTVTTGDTPSLGLVQDASGMKTPQTWGVGGNDQGFAIVDVTNSNVYPFIIETKAPYASFFVGFDGRIGMGTDTPLQKFHLFDSTASPVIRFQEATATPHTWDIVADHAGFDLVDVTNSNHIPFSVVPGAPTNSLFVASSGNLGLGTATPSTQLHVHKAAQASTAEVIARFDVSDDATGKLEIRNFSAGDGILHPLLRGTTASQAVALTFEGKITTDAGTNPVVAYDAARATGGAVVTRPLVVYRNNTVIKAKIDAQGNMTATSFSPSSSRELKDHIVDLDSRRASQALRQLTPVEYVYKDDPTGEGRVGFIAEDVPEIVANADRKSVPIMDVVALVTRVVKDQQQTIEEQKKSIDEQRKQLANERQRNEKLERTVESLMQRMADFEKLHKSVNAETK
jgi:hypothetical protein